MVLLVGDGGDPQHVGILPLLDRDCAVVVREVLDDLLLALQLPDLVEQCVAAPRKHEVEVDVDLLVVAPLDGLHHLAVGDPGLLLPRARMMPPLGR